jgi:hypothetical protein
MDDTEYLGQGGHHEAWVCFDGINSLSVSY